MRKPLPALAAALVLVAVASPARPLPDGTAVRNYLSANFPIDMAWVKGTKKIFFTEKSGAVKVAVRGDVKALPCTILPVATAGEQGALGIVLHPRFKDTRWLYVMYTNASPESMRVTRFTVRNDRCESPRHIMKGVPASSGYHNGGQLEFARGKLFVSTGENHDPAKAQDRTSRLGKILRFKAGGAIPDGNPFGNAVWSYGHRNPFGLATDPRSGRLYETENGPGCDDELNRIVKGRNYGWGEDYPCGTAGVGPNPKGPLRPWTPTVVPTDLTWYFGRIDSLSGGLFMGTFGSQKLHRFRLNERGTRILGSRTVLQGYQFVDVAKGPGGWLYFLTPDSIKRIVEV